MKRSIDRFDNIILASKSPRRLEILNAHGIEPVIFGTDTDEDLPESIEMEDAVMKLASEKADAALLLDGMRGYLGTNTLLIAADTLVYKDRIMGKPADAEESFAMLASLRGTSHHVATGVTLIDLRTLSRRTFCEITRVFCKNYSDDDIWEYIETEQPFDKAGSYAIQSSFAKHIDHIEGDYENVIGLPYPRILTELAAL
jgi:septum formation protein